MYRYAIIGAGGLGKVHLANLMRLNEERGQELQLCAICGTTKEALMKSVSLNFGTVDISKVDLSDVRFYDDYKDLIDTEQPDFAVSATPTFLHAEIAVYALSKGVHLYSEKPMALTLEDCDRMIEAAKKTDRFLMIGQTSRFSHAYGKLREYIQSDIYGKAYRFDFCRDSQMPLWSWNNWILDPKQSGGCVLDMHIHDVDLINWFFGMPKAVSAVGTNAKIPMESVSVQYTYDDMLGTGRADWSLPQQYPFTKRFTVNFEKAVVEIGNGKMVVYTDEETFEPELPADDIHYEAMKTFLKVILDGASCEQITSCESIRDSVAIALAEIESMKNAALVEMEDSIINGR